MNSGESAPRRASFFGSIPTKCRKTTISAVIVVIGTVVILQGRWWFAAIAESARPQMGHVEPPSVRVLSLTEEVITPEMTYSAVAKELRRTSLAFRVGGTLEYLLPVAGPDGVLRDVHEGDVVSKGTVIARLDTADFIREVNQAAERLATVEEKLKQLEADEELAKSVLRRTEAVVRQKAGVAADLDSAKAKALSSSAAKTGTQREVASAKVALEQAEANLKYCTLTVPFDVATIESRQVQNYESVAAGRAAFTLLDLSGLLVSFSVPDTVVGKLEIGQSIDATADALPGHRFTGRVQKISSSSDPQTRTYLVELRLDHPSVLRPGMVVTVHFRSQQTATLLPLTALTAGEHSGSAAVYRVENDGDTQLVRRVPIEIDGVVDDRVIVKAGSGRALNKGELIVTSGVHRLHDGQTVKFASESTHR